MQHVSKISTVKDHCRRFALSDPNDKSFQSPCSHKLTENCEQCDSLDNVMNEIKKAVVRLGESRACDSSLVEIKEELLFIVGMSKQDITSWKAHLLRSVNQDEARVDIIDKLDETSVLLVQDWAINSYLGNIEKAKEIGLLNEAFRGMSLSQ